METVAALLLTMLVAVVIVCLIGCSNGVIMGWFKRLRARKREAAERELDRAQAELRLTILHLAGQLGADAHEARKALIREAFLASGRVPRDH